MEEAKPFKQRPNVGSRVTRESHARFWERPEVKFLRATRRVSRAPHGLPAARNYTGDEGGAGRIATNLKSFASHTVC